jgi:hypothetical protein
MISWFSKGYCPLGAYPSAKKPLLHTLADGAAHFKKDIQHPEIMGKKSFRFPSFSLATLLICTTGYGEISAYSVGEKKQKLTGQPPEGRWPATKPPLGFSPKRRGRTPLTLFQAPRVWLEPATSRMNPVRGWAARNSGWRTTASCQLSHCRWAVVLVEYLQERTSTYSPGAWGCNCAHSSLPIMGSRHSQWSPTSYSLGACSSILSTVN